MHFSIDPRLTFRLVYSIGVLFGSCPTKQTDSEWLECLWWFRFLNYSLLFVPTVYGLWKNYKDVVRGFYTGIELTAIVEALLILTYVKGNKTSLRELLASAEEQTHRRKGKEVSYFATYYSIVYLLITSCNLALVIVFMQTPALVKNDVILTAVYPFDVKSTPVRYLLGFNQVFSTLNVFVVPNLDGIMTILLFSCYDRLKSLESDFENARDVDSLVACIREHQAVLRLIGKTNRFVRFMILKTVVSFMAYTLATGLTLLNLVEQTTVIAMAYSRIYICADFADTMSSVSDDIALVIYSSAWYKEEPKLVKLKSVIMYRCRALPTIGIAGIIPVLDRRYLGKMMYVTISYLMTLRAIADNTK